MLFLFSKTDERDAPTRICPGSHQTVARILAREGAAGLSFMDVAKKLSQMTFDEEVLATGGAGTVYLCHPFIVHAAQDHRGVNPRFMAQPPLLAKREYNMPPSADRCVPVERAIVEALQSC
jgi:hypothetical protein